MVKQLADAKFTLAPGTAPVALKDRFYKWRPRDWNVNAIARSSAPSAGIVTQTSDAINAMFAANVLCEMERGTYFVDKTISPNGFDTTSAHEGKQIGFHDTIIRAVAGATLSNFYECTSQGGNSSLAGANDSGDNLPAGVVTRVLFDVTNCLYYNYMGKLSLHGGSNNLALMACANKDIQGQMGPQGSTYDQIIMSNGQWGIFGTPRYGQARTFYAGVFVGAQCKRCRIYDCTYPILAGGNTIDDSSFGELNIIHFAGQTSYIYGAALVANTIYINGVPSGTAPVGFDLQESNFDSKTFYAEDEFQVPLLVRGASWVVGAFKYGAGANSTMDTRTMVHFQDSSGGGVITAHQRTGEAANDTVNVAGEPLALVSLQAVNTGANPPSPNPNSNSGDLRNVTVYQGYPEADLPPFIIIGGGTGTLSKKGNFISVTPDGMKGWQAGGSMASPTLTPTNLWKSVGP